jgi:anti-sigma factor RsiW
MNNESDIRGIACAEARQSLADYAGERLDETRRLEVRRHLLGCDRCREAGAAHDPSIIFMSPALVSPAVVSSEDAAFWTRFDATLRSRLEAEAARKRGPFAGLLDTLWGVPRLAYAAPILAATILAGLVFVRPGGLFHGPAGRSVEAIPSPFTAPAATAIPAAETTLAPDVQGRGRRLPTAADEIASLPTLEEVSSPNARVYRLDVPVAAVTGGSGSAAGGAVASGDSAAVYFVVDESINF